MVTSGSQELLDGHSRDAYQTYKGVGRLGENSLARPNTKNAQGFGGYDIEEPIESRKFVSGEALGHLCYSQAELTEWYKNVHFNNGFYRENSNGGKGFKKYKIKGENGKVMNVNPVARYSQGKTFINCTGGPVGQYGNKLNDFYVIDQINRSLGKNLKEKDMPKMRLYNSPDVQRKGVKEPERFLEMHSSSQKAPDMPEPCRELLDSLP